MTKFDWKKDSDTTIVHRTGFAVSFSTQPVTAQPVTAIVGISRIDALAGTPWAGKVGVLVEEAIEVWKAA